MKGSMRGFLVSEYGGIEVLKYMTDLSKPAIKPGHVLIRNKWAGINFIDIYQRTGHYKLALPFVPGRESTGYVEELGEGVHDLKVGDAVAALSGSTYAEYSVVERRLVSKIPDGVDLKDAAACFLQGMTASYLVTDSYRVKPGDFVLVPAVAGGTGLMIAQMAKASGATVIGTCSSEAKAKMAKEQANVEHVIIYTQQDVVKEVMRITNGAGVQVVYDGIGKASFDTSLGCLARRGSFISFGSASGPIDNLDVGKLTKNSISLMRPALFDYTRTQEELELLAGHVFRMLQQGSIKSTIYKIYPLEEAAQAQEDISSGKSIGRYMGPLYRYEKEAGNVFKLCLHVKPGAKQSRVTDIGEAAVGLQIAAPPRDGEANEEVMRFVGELFRLRTRNIELVGGHKSRDKTLLLRLDPDDKREADVLLGILQSDIK